MRYLRTADGVIIDMKQYEPVKGRTDGLYRLKEKYFSVFNNMYLWFFIKKPIQFRTSLESLIPVLNIVKESDKLTGLIMNGDLVRCSYTVKYTLNKQELHYVLIEWKNQSKVCNSLEVHEVYFKIGIDYELKITTKKRKLVIVDGKFRYFNQQKATD